MIPSQQYAHFIIKFRRESAMPEPELRKLLDGLSFSVANLNYRLIDDGKHFEYRMMMRTPYPHNVRHLKKPLSKTQASWNSAVLHRPEIEQTLHHDFATVSTTKQHIAGLPQSAGSPSVDRGGRLPDKGEIGEPSWRTRLRRKRAGRLSLSAELSALSSGRRIIEHVVHSHVGLPAIL